MTNNRDKFPGLHRKTDIFQRLGIRINFCNFIKINHNLFTLFYLKYLRRQIFFSFYEVVQLAVKHRLHVAGFIFRAMVFDQLIRMKDIRPDLIAPFYLSGLADIHPFFFFETIIFQLLIKFGRQNRQGLFAILRLRPLRIGMCRQVGRQVNNTHRRLALVNILSTRPTGPRELHFQFFFRNFYFFGFGKTRNNFHQSKRGMTQTLGAERLNAHGTDV